MKVLLVILLAVVAFVAGAFGGGFIGATGGGAAGAIVGSLGGACSVLQDAEGRGLLSRPDAETLFASLQDRMTALAKPEKDPEKVTLANCEAKLEEFRSQVAKK